MRGMRQKIARRRTHVRALVCGLGIAACATTGAQVPETETETETEPVARREYERPKRYERAPAEPPRPIESLAPPAAPAEAPESTAAPPPASADPNAATAAAAGEATVAAAPHAEEVAPGALPAAPGAVPAALDASGTLVAASGDETNYSLEARRHGGGRRPRGPGRGFPVTGPWVSFYGPARAVMPLDRVARMFRIINIDADPGVGAFSPAQIQILKAGGRNRVISYMNVGACENYREYWKTAPPGFVPCKENLRAHRARYSGYPDEMWMDLSNPDYQKLIVEHVAVRLAQAGVDGFFLDNMEIIEHGEDTNNGPCGSTCAQGGLELVARLRKAFPDHLIVMQNATSDVTRLGKTELGPFPSLLDGITHEQVFAPTLDEQALEQLEAWKGMNLKVAGRPFFIGVEDYVGDCKNVAKAKRVYAQNRARGFSPYASDASAGQQRICYWGF